MAVYYSDSFSIRSKSNIFTRFPIHFLGTRIPPEENDSIRDMVVPDQAHLESTDKNQDPISLLNKL